MKPGNEGYQTQSTSLLSLLKNGLWTCMKTQRIVGNYQIDAGWRKSGIPSDITRSCLISVHLVLNTPDVPNISQRSKNCIL